MRQMDASPSATAAAPATSGTNMARAVFHRTHLYISKQQGVGWLFLIACSVLLACTLAYIIVQSINTYNELNTCKQEADVAKCPTPGSLTSIWVPLLGTSIVAWILLFSAGMSFTYARV